jgi:hypothetical protein
LDVDCHTAVQNLFGATTVTMEDVKTDKRRFDLVGVFNSLDHFRDPVGLVEQLLTFTDYVYLEGHSAGSDWGKQHLYFIEPETVEMLPSLVNAAPVAGFERSAESHWYSILLKKRPVTT